MTTFATADDVYATIGQFLKDLVQEPEMKKKFLAANTSFRVIYSDPDAVMVVDCTVDPPLVTCGENRADT